MRSPVNASDRVGHMVAKKTNSAQASRIQLLSRNANSRDMNDSKLAAERRRGSRTRRSPSEPTRMTHMNRTKSSASALSSPNACTDCTAPVRVSPVPTMVRKKVMMTSTRFHTFIIPRCSWMMTACRKAVIVNQGRKPAFSTGSHAQ